GNRPVQCLLCVKEFVVKDLDGHIHKHLKYTPLKCGSCDYKTAIYTELEQHLIDNDDHQSTPAVVDPYKEWLAKTLRVDTLRAAREGVEAVMRTKQSSVSSQPTTPIIINLPFSTESTPVRKKKKKEKQPVPAKSSSEEEDEEREPTPPPRSAPKKKKRREEEEKQETSELDNVIEELVRESEKQAKCHKCKEMVGVMLNVRQAHVREQHMQHMVAEKNDEKYRLELENQTGLLFPGLVSNSKQCAKCRQAITTETGRVSHVGTHHLHRPYVQCPVADCSFDTKLHFAITDHLKKMHGFPKGRQDPGLAGAQFAPFHSNFDKNNEKIQKMIKLLFPLDLPPTDKDKKKKKGKATKDDEEDNLSADLSFIMNMVKNTDTPPLPTPKRGRTKSPSEFSDSDDEVKKIPKEKKEKGAVVDNEDAKKNKEKEKENKGIPDDEEMEKEKENKDIPDDEEMEKENE
ncbi:hypothetical protein PFISCL1PPCAC_25702, partial [Pristionchus fissidentatus]